MSNGRQSFRANSQMSWRYQMVKAHRHGQRLLRQGEQVEVMVGPVRRERTDPQRRTLWMWHGQVASELTLRTGHRWTKDDVHELIFLARFMPVFELRLPDGEVVYRAMRTSDRVTPDGADPDPRRVISEAMDQYLAWISEMAIDVTVPDPDEWRCT